MNMAKQVFDQKIQKIESSNSGLLIQNKKPLKIYLEGFPISEFVDLMKIVKDHGGEISSGVEAGVIILSHPNCSFETDSPKFHVNWLYDCIRSNKILNPSQYQLEFSSTTIKQEVEKEDYHLREQINVRSQQKNNSAHHNSLREDMTRISEGISLPQTRASTDIIDKNTVPENTSKAQRISERMRRSSLQPVYTSADSSEGKKPSEIKRHYYTEKEDRAMIQYLIDNDAIKSAGGLSIWKKMHEDGMMEHHTVNSMSVHFTQSLRPRVQDFTSDEDVLRQFRAKKRRVNKPRRSDSI